MPYLFFILSFLIFTVDVDWKSLHIRIDNDRTRPNNFGLKDFFFDHSMEKSRAQTNLYQFR